MQFAVPQFTDVEDKLIGPLTLKQFLILLAAGGLVLFFYSIFGKISIFLVIIFSLPIAIIGIALAFGKYNGRPLFGYTTAIISFITRPHTRIFRREDVNVSISFKTDKKPAVVAVNTKLEMEDGSRLKKLAYLLDQKTDEEKELIGQKTAEEKELLNNKK